MLRDPRRLEAIDESAETIQMPCVETVRAPERQSDAVHAQRVMRADELERAHRRAATHVVLGVHSQPGDGRTLGENLLQGSGPMSAAQMEATWMNSAPHRANILSSSFNVAGIGIAYGANGSLWVTVDFGGTR